MSALSTGRKVLDSLDRGRRIAIEAAQARAKDRATTISVLVQRELKEGLPARGRAVRIARAMKGELSVSQVRKIMTASRALFSVRDSLPHNPAHECSRDIPTQERMKAQ